MQSRKIKMRVFEEHKNVLPTKEFWQ